MKKKKKNIWQWLKANSGILFITPAIIIFVIFGLYTVVYSIVLSFFRWNGMGKFNLLPFECQAPACQFVGLDNFSKFLYDSPTYSRYFWWAIEHNLAIAVFVTLGTIGIALPLAVALNQATKGKGIYRTLMMLPMVTVVSLFIMSGCTSTNPMVSSTIYYPALV